MKNIDVQIDMLVEKQTPECFGSRNGYLHKCHEHAEFIPLGRGKVPCDHIEKCCQEYLRETKR